MKIKFDCICYYVSNLDRAIRFYSDALGFELISRDEVARFSVNNVLFELVPTCDPQKLRGNGNARLCLEVENAGAAAAELHAKSVSADSPEVKVNGVLCAFRDPDGNELLLWQYEDKARYVNF